jgi:two-component system sensor histidine kinase BaeS
LLLLVLLAGATGSFAFWSIASGGGFAGAHPRGPFPFYLLALLLLVVLVAVAVTRFRGFARPFNSLIQSAQRIERGDYSARVPEHGPPDMRSVARVFNQMSARLEADAARRQNFLADVAHELRTQLAVIRAQAEAIAEGVYAADAAHLSPILDTTANLEALVDDLRTLALSEVGALTLKKEAVDVGALIDETLGGLRVQADAAGITLRVEVADDLARIDADPVRLRGVLANLVANAIRHTPGGTITIGARRLGHEVEITVADNGEGVPPELLPHVFERFTKGPNSRGSGLGLAIARDVITAHGGTVDLASIRGAGTKLTIALPTI